MNTIATTIIFAITAAIVAIAYDILSTENTILVMIAKSSQITQSTKRENRKSQEYEKVSLNCLSINDLTTRNCALRLKPLSHREIRNARIRAIHPEKAALRLALRSTVKDTSSTETF